MITAQEDWEDFNLYFPGNWIVGADRDWADEVSQVLALIEDQLIEAVAAYALFKPITAENSNKVQSRYEKAMNGLAAKAFVNALHNIGKLLQKLIDEQQSTPSEVNILHQKYMGLFGHLTAIRDSAMHIENRGRGRDRHDKPIQKNILVISCFIAPNRYTFSGGDGKIEEIEIARKTLLAAKEIIQQVIAAYDWK